MLETDYDRQAEETLTAADDLAARFEEFLREDERDEQPADRTRSTRVSPR